jgi:4-methylaminobutanoate oxidase (formaldehyde-forming)
MQTLVRERDFQVGFGVPNRIVGPAQIAELFPLAKVDDLIGGSYVADEGRADPVGVATSLAKGARMGGATIVEGVQVTGFLRQGRRIAGVVTDRRRGPGRVGGPRLPACGRDSSPVPPGGRPLQAAEHYYLLTEADDRHPPGTCPIIEDLDCYGYFREEGGGMLVGLFEPQAAAWHPGRHPMTSPSGRSRRTGIG